MAINVEVHNLLTGKNAIMPLDTYNFLSDAKAFPKNVVNMRLEKVMNEKGQELDRNTLKPIQSTEAEKPKK